MIVVIDIGENAMQILWIVSGLTVVIFVVTLFLIAYAFYNFHKQSKQFDRYGKFW
jgi:hypothetical protein